jgi:isopentenyl phosphate kinase
LIVLKLGGSVITKKERPMTPDMESIRRLAEEVAEAKTQGLIVVHGGGSFGHTVAKQYSIAEGLTSRDQTIGFSRTHQAMVELNRLVINALLDNSVPSVSVTPSSFVIMEGGRIALFSFDVVRLLVELEMIPVLYGDAALDRERGFSILSGDQIASFLAAGLGASRLVFGVDVDGVCTSDPKMNPDASLIEVLPLDRLREMVDFGRALTTDVTGGMLGKVMETAVAVEAGVEVIIVNALRPGIVYKALKGEHVTGTVLVR